MCVAQAEIASAPAPGHVVNVHKSRVELCPSPVLTDLVVALCGVLGVYTGSVAHWYLVALALVPAVAQPSTRERVSEHHLDAVVKHRTG